MSEKVILIVDDNKHNLFTLKSILSKLEGYRIVEANNGKDALKITTVMEIDLILLDIQMPELDGFQVAELLKSTKRTRNIPIIFITAVFKEDIFIKKGFDLGAIDYITKPINRYSLLTKIQLYEHIERQNLSESKNKIMTKDNNE